MSLLHNLLLGQGLIRPQPSHKLQHVKVCSTLTTCYYGRAMKTNVTLKLDADLLREARVVAAEEGRSISALLAARSPPKKRLRDEGNPASGDIGAKVASVKRLVYRFCASMQAAEMMN